MNIDVTVMGLSEQWRNGAINGSSIRTWSEKFKDVAVEERDGKLSVKRSANRTDIGERRYIVKPETVAEFASGAWHSWRQVKD